MILSKYDLIPEDSQVILTYRSEYDEQAGLFNTLEEAEQKAIEIVSEQFEEVETIDQLRELEKHSFFAVDFYKAEVGKMGKQI